jgi:hypothetical protein
MPHQLRPEDICTEDACDSGVAAFVRFLGERASVPLDQATLNEWVAWEDEEDEWNPDLTEISFFDVPPEVEEAWKDVNVQVGDQHVRIHLHAKRCPVHDRPYLDYIFTTPTQET